MATQNALKHIFLGGRGGGENIRTSLYDMIDKSMKDSTYETECILHGESGTNGQPIGLEQYQRVVGFLRENGEPFDKKGEEIYINIVDEKNSSIRVTITGEENVRSYCESDKVGKDATYMMKQRIPLPKKKEEQSSTENGESKPDETADQSEKEQIGMGRPASSSRQNQQRISNKMEPRYYGIVDENVGYRFNIKTETPLDSRDVMVRDLLSKWGKIRKYYRIIQRESFIISKYFRVDCSRVRSGRGNSLEDSGVLDIIPEYEVEIEFIAANVLPGISTDTILKKFMNLILHLLRVLRGTWFIIREDEQIDILRDYATLTGQDPTSATAIGSRGVKFIGPMPITLNRIALRDIRSGNYTATKKADGERALFMIGSTGMCYFIYRTLRIEGTGMIVKDKSLFKTILDGEVITKIKVGDIIQEIPPMYFVFDAYLIGGEHIQALPLYKPDEIVEDIKSSSSEGVATGATASVPKSTGRTRWGLSSVLVDKLAGFGEYDSLWGDESHVVRLAMKPFVMVPTQDDEIQKVILELTDTKVPYISDGIIFTPNKNAVNNYSGLELVNIRGTWSDVMKWKPPEDNTIDFLLRISPELKDTLGGGKFREGTLYVLGDDITDTDLYRLQEMSPTEVGRELASRENKIIPFRSGVSKIQLELDDKGIIRSRSNEIIQDNIIVECAWEHTLKSYMDDETGGWIIRNIRWDKTSVLRGGRLEGTMNRDTTAKSVWDTAVSDPIKFEDLWSSSALFVDEPDGGDEEVGEAYFNKKGLRDTSLLTRMRDFHNLVVKNYLIRSIGAGYKGARIVDIACGKGNDLSRFQKSNASFVLGLDVNTDNILNIDDGAIRRYIGFRNRRTKMTYALVDCGKDIFAEKSALDEESKRIMASIATDGVRFDRGTCMFAIHYFFKDLVTVDTIFSNISRLLRGPTRGDILPPAFVFCYYDANKVHRLLMDETSPDDRTYRSIVGTDVAWSIKALYNVEKMEEDIQRRNGERLEKIKKGERTEEFEEGPEGLGVKISVYIRSIDKAHDEYLVGRRTLKEAIMRNGMYLYEKAPRESPTTLQTAIEETGKKTGFKIPGTGFETLFKSIKPTDLSGKAREMTDYEKKLSFLYRWDVALKLDKISSS
jgi:SAM-dependent methyltransferase